MYRNTNDINNTEYHRMRKAEDSSYEYHGADAEETDKAIADDGYPEVVEHNESGSVYDLKTDFIVLLPGEIIRIPQDSNLAWMTMYETPSAVSKRIDRIAEQYEAFINPLPEGAERAKPEKKRL